MLLSGRGSNFQALHDACTSGLIPDAGVVVVLSNREDAPGLELARMRGVPSFAATGKGRDARFVELLRQHEVELVCLAGYMRLLPPEFVRAFPVRILNMHPSLLPAFPGLDAQAQALRYGVRVAGCTVHFVDEELDHGVIVEQASVPVLPEDDEASLAARILCEEHRIYPVAVARVLAGGWRVEGRRLVDKPDKVDAINQQV